MADVFDEVEEELRRDRYVQMFRQWAPWLVGGAVLIVVGVSGYQWYQSSQRASQGAAGDIADSAIEAVQEGNLELAQTQFQTLLEGAPGEYDVIALLQLGALAADQGNMEEAGRYYSRAAQAASDPVVRDTALYHSLLIELPALSYDDMAIRANPLVEGDSALELMAVELLGLSAIQHGRWEEARGHYQRIQFGLDAPQNMAQRATEAMSLINQIAPQTDSTGLEMFIPDDGSGEETATQEADAPSEETQGDPQ